MGEGEGEGEAFARKAFLIAVRSELEPLADFWCSDKEEPNNSFGWNWYRVCMYSFKDKWGIARSSEIMRKALAFYKENKNAKS